MFPSRDRRLTHLLVVRLILGFIFIYAGINKAIYPVAFAGIIHNYRILPVELINFTAVILPWIEILLGLFLIFGIWMPGAVALCNILLLTFFCSLLFNMLRGLNIDCGCFRINNHGSVGNHMWWYLVRDFVFILLGIYLFVQTLFKSNRRADEK